MLWEPQRIFTNELAMGVGFIPYEELFGVRESIEAPLTETYTTTPFLVGYAADLEEKVFGKEPEKTPRDIENAAFKLLYDFLLFGNPQAGQDAGEVTDQLMEVAQLYIVGGMDAVIGGFKKHVIETIEFIVRLRLALGVKSRKKFYKFNPEISQITKHRVFHERNALYKRLRRVLFH